MFLDALTLLSDAQAFPGAATISTNVIDLGLTTPAREIGTGEAIGVGVGVDVAAGAGSTVTIEVIQSTTAAMAAPDVIATLTDVAANFPAGALKFINIPMGLPTKQFLAARVTVASGVTTVTATIWLTARSLFSIQAKAYAKNYAV
jgi:hypothetical protein